MWKNIFEVEPLDHTSENTLWEKKHISARSVENDFQIPATWPRIC